MLHKEWIEYLKRENKSENCDQIKNYYMPRKLRRFIQIDRKSLETKKDDKEKDKKADDFTIVHTIEEFNDKCSQSHSQKRNVHYLIQDENNQNQLKWQKSNGPISTLKKYSILNKECEQSIDEEEIFHKTNNDKVLIISAEPGMGKSLILDHFTQNSTAENFFIKIILNTCRKTLSDKNFKEKLQNREDDLIEFVLKSLLNKTDEHEISLLKHLAQKERLILMFDGLDEVNDYKEQVIQLIDALNRDCKLKKILITTRNHLREELEDHFSTFSFNLNNFGSEDQKNFLVKYWRILNLKNPPRPTSANKLMQSAEELIARIKSISSDNINQLIGIPLQTKMLADIYFERVKKREDFSNLILTNIAELYNEFIESKIKIHFERTNNNIKIEQLSKQIQERLLEILKTEFYSDHTKLSSLIIFEQNNQNEFDEENKVQTILEYGVIVAFKNRIPTFLHQSFAEFFLAKSCLQKVNEKNKGEELKEMLRDERHFLIRRFLNDLMVNDENFKNQREKQEENKNEVGKEDFNQEIENCCRENLLFLLKYFVENVGANLKTKNKFLIEASKNDHKDIVDFLLEKGIDVNQHNEYGRTALMWASREGHKQIVQMLLQDKNIEINQQDEDGYTALMLASINGHKDIVQMLLRDKNIQINQQDKKGDTALIVASEHGHKEIVQMLLQDERIEINQGNITALISASQEGHKEIVQMLLQDKNIEINKQDWRGHTALMWASYHGYKEIVEMLLKDEKIEINQQDTVFGDTALISASSNGHKEIVQMLLQDENIEINLQDNNGWTSLMWAFRKSHKEIVEMLLQHENIQINQQDEYGETALMVASHHGYKEIVEMLLKDEKIEINLQDKYGNTALMGASREGHKEIVQMLLQHKNIQINQQDKGGYTALMWASRGGHKDIVEMLNDENNRKNQKNIYGDLALITASREGHKDIVQMLLQNENIQINQQDEDGYTALMWASGNGHKDIVEMLNDENKRKNQKNIYGEFALITASREGHKEIVEMLLQDKNILINKQNKYGQTALMWASLKGHREIVQMLLQHKNIQINK
jgi:ankyrin repeat protein